MDTEHIREFIVLAQIENYLAAAEELFISQPTLTKHIKALEAELGVLLFDRSTRQVKLSKFGKAFLPYAHRIAEADEDAQEALSKLSRDSSNTLNLGVLPSFVIYNIPEYITRFKRKYPDYSINLLEGKNKDLMRWLSDGRCNLVFVRHPDDEADPRFVRRTLVRDSLVVVVPFGHPLDDGRTSVHVSELAEQELLISTSATQEQILRELGEKVGVKLNLANRLGLGHPELIPKMLEQGFGPAIINRHSAVSAYSDRLCILDLVPETSTTISLAYLKSESLNAASRDFWKIVFSESKNQ